MIRIRTNLDISPSLIPRPSSRPILHLGRFNSLSVFVKAKVYLLTFSAHEKSRSKHNLITEIGIELNISPSLVPSDIASRTLHTIKSNIKHQTHPNPIRFIPERQTKRLIHFHSFAFCSCFLPFPKRFHYTICSVGVVVYWRGRAILEAGGRKGGSRRWPVWLGCYCIGGGFFYFFGEGGRCGLRRYRRANAGKCISVPEVRWRVDWRGQFRRVRRSFASISARACSRSFF